jgi:hypothetical protein
MLKVNERISQLKWKIFLPTTVTMTQQLERKTYLILRSSANNAKIAEKNNYPYVSRAATIGWSICWHLKSTA